MKCDICNKSKAVNNFLFESAWGMCFCNECIYKVWVFIDDLKEKNSGEGGIRTHDPK